jgi:hypothetical protein
LRPKNYEFHLVTMRRGEWPTPWMWEIFLGDKPLKYRVWGGYFKSEAMGRVDGRAALEEFLHLQKTEGAFESDDRCEG